jgi:two-component system phosphate regulon sensor histidine kinase PhoR
MHIDYINFIGAKMLGLSKRSAIGKELDEHLLKAKEEVLLVKCKELLIHVLAHKTMVTDSIAIENTAKIYYDLIAAPRAGHGAILVIQDRSSQRKVLEMGKDFIANASHELRTPITIIKGFAETLEDMKEMPHDMLSSIVEKIVRNCERMENLVSNLLTLADMENLSISPYVSCDVIALIQGCMDIVSSVYPDAVIHLHTTREPIYAAADASIMELALINLLTNAAKYSQGPATIDVKVEAASEDVIISISDHGIGIPAADLEHIFERFYTVNKAHSRKLGGAGLGLSLVKTIIEKHHGSIEVSSTLGRGTTFTIHLPLPRGG